MLKLQFIIISPNYNTVILFSTQTMDRLKQLLDKNNFTYTEKTFESEEDIAGLGSEPFVSDSRTKEFVKLHFIISLHSPQDPNIRIYIIATYAVHARPLLCEV